MTALQLVALTLPARFDEGATSRFELVFSELLDSAATSYWRDENGNWKIEALFDFTPDAALLDELLAPLYQKEQISCTPISVTSLEKRDWVAENRAAFPPLKIGRFWVHGSHVITLRPAASLPLLIDAALAFGSGTHPTTEGCLRALQMIPPAIPRQILDLGCGSAILAIAAARLWPSSRIIAVDNDPIAVRVAAKNRALNGVAAARMRLAVSQGFGSRMVRNNSPYNLVLANIMAGPLTLMAPDVASRLKASGWLVLSGILNTQAVRVEAAYRAQRMRVWSRICLGDWTTIIMRPAGAGTMPQLWDRRW